jgi:predicted transcriptional regulator
MPTFALKAAPKASANGIIISFGARWEDALRAGNVQVVFRKKCPSKYVPKFVYAYLASPVSAIVARLPVLRIERLISGDALLHTKEGAISKAELDEYCATVGQVFLIWIGTPSIARKPVTMQTLMTEYEFWPTPNFIALSDYGCGVIDRLGDFQVIQGGK